MVTCLVENCSNSVKSKGLCNKHYLRQWKYGSTDVIHVDMSRRSPPNTSLARRFWSLVQVAGEDECWPWLGTTCKGYGKITHERKTLWAHRVSFELTYNIEPLTVLHSCDNPTCVNPGHLIDGTQLLNIEDSIEKGRARITHRSGEHSYQSKVTWREVIEIRESSASLATLAALYGLSKSSVWAIRKGKTWKTPGEVRLDIPGG